MYYDPYRYRPSIPYSVGGAVGGSVARLAMWPLRVIWRGTHAARWLTTVSLIIVSTLVLNSMPFGEQFGHQLEEIAALGLFVYAASATAVAIVHNP